MGWERAREREKRLAAHGRCRNRLGAVEIYSLLVHVLDPKPRRDEEGCVLGRLFVF